MREDAEARDGALEQAVDIIDALGRWAVRIECKGNTAQSADLQAHGLGVGQGALRILGLECEPGLIAQDREEVDAPRLGRVRPTMHTLALGDAETLGLSAVTAIGEDALLEDTEALVHGPIGLAEGFAVQRGINSPNRRCS